jgi:peptidylprolyl isomerase
VAVVALAAIALAGCGGAKPAGRSTAGSAPAPATPTYPSLPPEADAALAKRPTPGAGGGALAELAVTTLAQGKGAEVKTGQTITVNYVGASYATGAEFDSSWSRSEPFTFVIGTGGVIEGWDRGLLGVKVGSRVRLDIPAALAYGDNAGGGAPSGPLRFVVDILAAR